MHRSIYQQFNNGWRTRKGVSIGAAWKNWPKPLSFKSFSTVSFPARHQSGYRR
jgi:hypothetical protein